MFVVITGGGRTATQLASYLIELGHRVHIIEYRPVALKNLHKELPTEIIFEGHPTDPAVLKRAGMDTAQVLAALSDQDANNLTTCFLARKLFNVPRTIGRINSPRNAWLFDKTFNVDVALNQAAIFSSLIEEEMSLGDMMTLLKIRRGNYSLVEEKIPTGAPAIGLAIKDLPLPESTVIAAIIRHGDVVVPRGMTVIEAEDEVLAITDRPGAQKLAELFSRPGQ